MLKGYLSSTKNMDVSERKLKNLMPAINFQGHCDRDSHERTNPRLYISLYFGHKLHIDQNEKLVHYGVHK